MSYFDDEAFLAALALPGGVPRGQGGPHGNGNIRGDGGDRGQERGRRRGGLGGGRGSSQDLNFHHSANTSHTTPNANQQGPPPVTSGFGNRGWGEPSGFGGRGASPNAPKPFNTRGGCGGMQSGGRGGGRGGYNQMNVGIQNLGYNYNAVPGGIPERGGRFGVDFGEGNRHSRKIQFAKSSVMLFQDQAEVFKSEVDEIDAEDRNGSPATADQVNAVVCHDEEPSESDGNESAGDISYATPPFGGEEDKEEDLGEEEDAEELAEVAATLVINPSEDVILIHSSQLEAAKSVQTIASSTTIVTMENITMTFAPPEDLSGLLSPPSSAFSPTSPNVDVVKDDGGGNREDESTPKEEDVEKATQRVDKGKQRASEVEDVVDMLHEDDGREELDFGDLWQGFFTANDRVFGRGKGIPMSKPLKYKKGHAPDSVPPEPDAHWIIDQVKKAAHEEWRSDQRANAPAKSRRDVNTIAALLKEFVRDYQRNTLKLLALSKPQLNKMNTIAKAYYLKCHSKSDRAKQITTLVKTRKTGVNVDYAKLNAALLALGPHRGVERVQDGSLKKTKHREGDIAHLTSIFDESDVGYRLLPIFGESISQ